MRKALWIGCLVAVVGCSGPTFRNIGNNVGVSTASIEDYATRHGVTHEQAVQELRMEIEQNHIVENAKRR